MCKSYFSPAYAGLAFYVSFSLLFLFTYGSGDIGAVAAASSCIPSSNLLTEFEVVNGGGEVAVAINLKQGPTLYSGTCTSVGGYADVIKTGDLNADGLPDFAIEMPKHDVAALDDGALYVVYGRDFTGEAFKYSDVGVTLDGFRLYGATSDAHFGIGAVADMDRDGKTDLVLSAHNYGTNYGRLYYLSGADFATWKAGGDIAGYASQTLDGLERYSRNTRLNIGGDVALGDLNADGYNDVFVNGSLDSSAVRAYCGGAVLRSCPAGENAGVAFICQGPFPISWGTSCIALDFTTDYIWAAEATVAIGDFNGDGCKDVVTGDENAQSAYLLLQQTKATKTPGVRTCNGFSQYATVTKSFTDSAGTAYSIPTVDLTQVGRTNGSATIYGIQFNGDMQTIKFGKRVAFVGDVNKDGAEDLVIGAYHYCQTAYYDATAAKCTQDGIGGAWLVYGIKGYYYKTINWTEIQTTYGYLFEGDPVLASSDEQKLGRTVSSAGDMNKDGYADFFVGTQAGQLWLVPGGGKKRLGNGPIATDQRARLYNAPNAPNAGDIVGVGIGDLNADGYDDAVIIDTPYGQSTAYIVNGGPFCP